MHLDFSMSRFGVEGSLELLLLEWMVPFPQPWMLANLNGNFIYKLITDTRLKTTFTQS